MFDSNDIDITVRNADEGDIEELSGLYKSVIGAAFCVWDEFYPTEGIITRDILDKNLYVFENEDGRIDGAFAIDRDEDIASLSCWRKEEECYGEISRLVVRPSVQGMGIAGKLLRCGMNEPCRRGFERVRFLVAAKNLPAVKAYNKISFEKVGSTTLFDIDFYCYERELDLVGGVGE